MSSTTPAPLHEKISEEEKAVVLERRKTLETDRKKGSNMDEVFLRITQHPKP